MTRNISIDIGKTSTTISYNNPEFIPEYMKDGRRKIAYVISPYRAKDFWNRPIIKWLKIAWNIYKARKVAKEFWQKGFVVLAPQLNSCFIDGICDDKIFLDGDLQLLRLCDTVVVCEGWSKSVGCVFELAEARLLGKEIIWHKESRWMR